MKLTEYGITLNGLDTAVVEFLATVLDFLLPFISNGKIFFIVKAFEQGRDHVDTAWEDVHTQVHGVRVPKPIGDRLILRVIRESNGHAVAVTDQVTEDARAELAREEGVHVCPEGALCYAALKEDLLHGRVSRGAQVVLFNTASGLKSPMPPVDRSLDCTRPIDYAGMI